MGAATANFDPTVRAQLAALPPGQDASQTIGGASQPPITRRLVNAAASPGPVVRRLGYDEGEELARGGLGMVLEAVQQAFDRPVAIKRLLKANDRTAALHFYAEAVVAAQLQHPNIVPTYDLMADAEGRLSLVMKRVYGRSWRQLLHPGDAAERAAAARYGLDDHLEILLKVCDAVGYAHSRGIIHRDLKPDNVMVGEHGEVEVMDWGCAVACGDHPHHPVVPRVEEVERISGTPSYMAPEMVILEPNRISERSDVYLLGGILYDILTGTRPHRGADLQEVFRHAAWLEVPPPAERAPDRDIPEELAAIAMAALARDPDQRTRSAAAFAEALRGYRRHAQALALAALARRRLAEAGEARAATVVDERLRRACAAAENAAELWPDWREGRALVAEATLAWARHCLATGGSTQAQALAAQAAAAARAAEDAGRTAAARACGEEARRAEGEARRRARALRLLRSGVLVLAGLVAIGAVAAATVFAQQRRTAEEARRAAEMALARLNDEQAGRRADRVGAVPAMLAQARTAVAGGDLAAAEAVLAQVLDIAPQEAEAAVLRANLLAALGRWPQAAVAAGRWLELRPGDAAAGELRQLARDADGTAPGVLAGRLADLLLRQRLPSLVRGDAASPATRLAAYRARLEQSWPGLGPSLVMDPDGSVRFDWGKPSLAGRADLTDIASLRGIPFATLDLSGTRVVDLAPLAGMPLRTLVIDRTPVQDLRPLAGGPLAELRCNGLESRTLPRLAGLRLRQLTACNNPRMADLGELRGMPLESIWTDQGRVSDLTPLQGMPLKSLGLHGDYADLAPLRGMPLASASIDGAVSDLSPLAGLPLTELNLASTVPVDLAGLPTGLRRLTLDNVALTSPAPLARLHPEYLRLHYLDRARVPDPRAFAIDRLAVLVVDVTIPLDLSPFAAAPLQELAVYGVGQDFACLARTPVKRLAVGDPAGNPASWRALAAFRTSPAVESVEVLGKRHAAAQFWPTYDPDAGFVTVTIPGDFAADAPAAVAPGLVCERFPGVVSSVDDFTRLRPEAQPLTPIPTVSDPPERTGWRFTGWLTIPRTGEWTITTTADDGVRVLLHDKVVVDDDGWHPLRRASGRIRLAAGPHRVGVLYFNAGSTGSLAVAISGPGQPEIPVPAAWWGH